MSEGASRETRKRKREVLSIFLLITFFVALAWFEYRIFLTSQALPFINSIFFFGLVNFNICLLLFLLFLIFRNLFKAFIEQKKGVAGSSLRSRLVITFFVFSAVPTILMFFVSVLYINSSFDKWFSEKITGVMKSALEVTQQFYSDTKKDNFHAADMIAKRLVTVDTSRNVLRVLKRQKNIYRMDAIEYYDDIGGDRLIVMSKDQTLPKVPVASADFLTPGIEDGEVGSSIQEFTGGNLIRTMVPVKGRKAVVITTRYVPLPLLEKMNNIGLVYEELRGSSRSIQNPLKSIYIIMLLLMTLVILFCATWFGFHMAQHLSRALAQLSEATRRIASGDYRPVEIDYGETEVKSLADNFNKMAEQLETSQNEVTDATESLKETLSQLDERSRYVEVILSNVSTAVISLDVNDRINTINESAVKIFQINPTDYIGKDLKEIIGEKYYRFYRQMYLNMAQYNIGKMTRQLEIDIKDVSFPSLFTISRLIDQNDSEWGRVIGFDDLTDVLKSQKIEAWKEVARRIAHEIKNPLTPIKLSAQRLQKKFGSNIDDDAFKACTDMIIQQTDMMKTLVNEFSEYARMPRLKKEPNNMNELIESIGSMYSQAYKNVEFKLQLDDQLQDFLFDIEQLKRAFINLVENSVVAMEETTDPKIELRSVLDERRQVVQLVLADNGPGVEASVLSKLFEPYYSTKPGGSGLGLAIVNKAIEDHRGVIRACPNPGGGLMFNIEMPYLLQENQQTDAQPKS